MFGHSVSKFGHRYELDKLSREKYNDSYKMTQIYGSLK